MASITLRGWDGPIAFKRGPRTFALHELSVERTVRSTTLSADGGGECFATVEHLFAALAAHHVHRGCLLELDGPEVPLLDGAAARFSAAVENLALEASPPSCLVARSAEVRVGESLFRFTKGETPRVAVEFVTNHPRLSRFAAWDGTTNDFARIAPARTFVTAKDLEGFAVGELAAHAPKESVLVLTESDILYSGPEPSADEPARHKLLDLIGDLFVVGGPPVGSVEAVRPGHFANARAFEIAFREGVLVPFEVANRRFDVRAER